MRVFDVVRAAAMAGGVVVGLGSVGGCESVKEVGSSVGSTLSGILPGGSKDDINAEFGQLESSQDEARGEVEAAYAALEDLAEAPADEVDVYYAQYREASQQMRSQISSYGAMIDEVEAKADAQLAELSKTIGDEGNSLAQEQFDKTVEENRESYDSLFEQARSVLAQLGPLADEMDAQALSIKGDLQAGSTDAAKRNLNEAKVEVDKVLAEFDEGAEEIEKVVDESTAE